MIPYTAPTFRGVPLGTVVDVSSDGIGRRVAVHEYPGSDGEPYTQDRGTAAKAIRLSCTFTGAGAIAAKRRLVEALEKPGPGILNHPSDGQLLVVPRAESSVTEVADRIIVIAVFQLAGRLTYPEIGNSADRIASVAEDTLQAALDAFAAAFDVSGAVHVLTSALQSAQDRVDAIRDAALAPLAISDGIGDVVRALDDLDDSLADLIATPSALAAGFSGALAGIDNIEALQLLVSGTDPAVEPVAVGTPESQDVVDNDNALRRLVVRCALCQLATLAIDYDWSTYDDAEAMRDTIAEALDGEADDATSQEEIDALRALHTRTVQGLSDISAELPRLRDLEVDETTPALVLAWRLFADADRATEIVERNRIPHPLFCPPGTYRVLTR